MIYLGLEDFDTSRELIATRLVHADVTLRLRPHFSRYMEVARWYIIYFRHFLSRVIFLIQFSSVHESATINVLAHVIARIVVHGASRGGAADGAWWKGGRHVPGVDSSRADLG